MSKYKDNVVLKKSFSFSLDIITFCNILESKKLYNVKDQLFRSGTSICANIAEAQEAESRKDFIHKLKIAIKEARETEYWLLLCMEAEDYPGDPELLAALTEIIKLLGKIISSTQKSLKRS